MTKQVSFELFAANLFTWTSLYLLPLEQQADEARFLSTIASAFLASILASISSQPGDVLLTRLYNHKDTHDSPFENTWNVYRKEGIEGLFTGFSARLKHVAVIVTSQLMVYDCLKQCLGLPATVSDC